MPINRTLYDVLLFTAGFILLAGGAEFLVRGASRIALRFNVPSTIVGLTIVAFGTSLPEMLVSVVANLEGDGDLAIGNIVGSNIINFGLILGIAGLLVVIPIERRLIRREFPMLLVTSVVFILLAWDGILGRLDALVLLGGLVAFTCYTYLSARSSHRQSSTETPSSVKIIKTNSARPDRYMLRDALYVVLGLFGLVAGAEFLVSSSESIARAAGVSELVIGLSLVALGTGLPELATTVVAVLRKEVGMAFGNIVGSNLLNMLSIGGVTALLRPLPVPSHMRFYDFPVMLGFVLFVFLVCLPTPHRIERWLGGVLVALYIGYISVLYSVIGL